MGFGGRERERWGKKICGAVETGSAWSVRKACRDVSGGAVWGIPVQHWPAGGRCPVLKWPKHWSSLVVLLTSHWHWQDETSVICTVIPFNSKLVSPP